MRRCAGTPAGDLRAEHFYYDGVRRIQEVVTDPVLDLQSALASLIDAHHIIPKSLQVEFHELGVNIHNPIFGQWIERSAHQALHASDAYTDIWKGFYQRLRKLGVTGDAAVQATLDFIRDELAPEFGFQVPF